ncbi:MAG: cysteine synthase A [Gammaproteobacteria bacterium]|nr:cysteine synthase A [Gammaproteobacteria bacterium]
MTVFNSIIDGIGNTPLFRLRRPSEITGCDILAKAEFSNPGASVKDRAALGIIQDAARRGLIEPGGTVVEGTAGNTGIGLAVVGNALGYRTVVVMPNTQSQEKVDALKAYGCEIRQIPAVPYKNPNHFIHQSRELAEELAKTDSRGVLWANQFDNTANREIHFSMTGPEIWQQTNGKVDGFVCAVGSGGTLAGVSAYLREKNPDVKIGLSDPAGSGLYNYFANGEFKIEGSSIAEGIGNSRITGNLDGARIDFPFQIPDSESLPEVFSLLRDEGYCLGASSGVNVSGAVRLARELGPGHTVVTILCDSGLRYLQRLYNPVFLRDKNIPVPDWLE